MELDWIATDPDSGRLSHTERRSSVETYESRIEVLRALGEGYTEVSWADRDYPHVALSFRNPYGVVHYMSEDKIYLLAGDGVIGDDQTADVPGLEGDSRFMGAFVLSADHAWEVVKAFLRSGSIEDLGQCWEL
jgi:hypothetical protein